MPLRYARHLVALCCPEGGLVVDPFCGSGTTGVAARQLGRRFVGIEEHLPYVPECVERLAGATRVRTAHAEQLALEGAG